MAIYTVEYEVVPFIEVNNKVRDMVENLIVGFGGEMRFGKRSFEYFDKAKKLKMCDVKSAFKNELVFVGDDAIDKVCEYLDRKLDDSVISYCVGLRR